MATKKTKTEAPKKSEAPKEKTNDEKAARRKARMEALKNRPVEQRPNSKQIDVIDTGNGVVKNYGYPIKNRQGYQGVVVTSVLEDKDGKPIASSVTFVEGNLTVKVKKGHGVITSPKNKKEKGEEDNEDNED